MSRIILLSDMRVQSHLIFLAEYSGQQCQRLFAGLCTVCFLIKEPQHRNLHLK
jgi:hypothetical protein